MQGSLNRDLKTRLECGDQVIVVHVDDSHMDTLNQVFLLNDHVALDYAVTGHQNDHIGVKDVRS